MTLELNQVTMKSFSKESLDDLEKGIKQLLLEDRCSFTVNDHVLLQTCLELISSIREGSILKLKTSAEVLSKVIELITKLLVAGDHLKNIF
jgi:hypothetical protein